MNKKAILPKDIGFTFEGETTTDVLKKVWEAIQTQGKEYPGQRGKVRSLKAAMMIINNPLSADANYPYWEKPDDDWYQDNFVRKDTDANMPPEYAVGKGDIYPYKYVWRSRYFDGGVGYVKGVLEVFKQLGITQINLNTESDIVELIKSTYQLYHPESVLAVLSWKGVKLLNFYLKNPQILDLELDHSRRDTLQSVIDEIKHSPSSRRAITPSFVYEQIDHSAAAGGIPVYQNYQMYVNFNEKGEPEGLTSMHLHRAMDAKGGTQLDITHDREWGLIASKQLGLPLQKIVIYCNDIWHQLPENGKFEHLESKTDIRHWLFAVTDAYDPETEDIEKRLASPSYQKKIKYTLEVLNK